MSERDLRFWEMFSHEWAGRVLLCLLSVIVLAIVCAQWAKRRPTPVTKRVNRAANTALVLGILGFLASQMHLPCAVIASRKSQCYSHLRRVANDLTLYTVDNDGRYCPGSDWDKLVKDPADLKCPSADGPVSYAFNQRLLGFDSSKLEDPANTVLVFDAEGKSVGGQELLARTRHLDHPNVACADGHVLGGYGALGKAVRW